MAPRLKIYFGPEDSNVATVEPVVEKRETVTVPLADVFPLLADAIRSERSWLQDFADDPVTISADLYEVVMAYQHYRRPTA